MTLISLLHGSTATEADTDTPFPSPSMLVTGPLCCGRPLDRVTTSLIPKYYRGQPIRSCQPTLRAAEAAVGQLHAVADYYLESNEQTRNSITWLPDFYLLKAKGFMRQGMIKEAHDVVEKGYALAKEIKLNRVLWQITAELADIKAELDGEETAVSLRQEARATPNYIIEHIPKGELRASFLTNVVAGQLLAA